MRMTKKDRRHDLILVLIILASFLLKLTLIIIYGNRLNLSSDDLNYIKSAIVLLKRGILTYQNFNEPTVFIMPLYPFFLAGIFKVFGYGFFGMQAARVVQVILSSLSILLCYLIAKRMFDGKTALLAAFLMGFYLPNITTPGFFLTETLFTTLLYVLIYLSLKFSDSPGVINFAVLGVVWAAVTLCRPILAVYPLMLFPYLLLYHKYGIGKLVKWGGAMLISFIILMSPWWIRNYIEYSTFIPLSASSGNPMLQGTYVWYRQTPENIEYYKLGENAFETNKTEVELAKKRMITGFKTSFWRYLRWYTIDKTMLFWGTTFYWKEFFGIKHLWVLRYHYFLLLGIPGIIIAMRKNPLKYILPVLVMLYFNFVHCVYMAFDRYAFPVMPLMSIFCAFFVFKVKAYFNSMNSEARI